MKIQKALSTFRNFANRSMLAANNLICRTKEHIANDNASENVQSTILIVCCFVVGAILIGILVLFFGTTIKTWITATAANWFKTGGEAAPSGI